MTQLRTDDTEAGVDLVVPVHNEQASLRSFIAALQRQEDYAGRRLAPNRLQLIVVDNGSTDQSSSLVKRLTQGFTFPPTVLLHEPVKSHIQARICGATFALSHPQQTQFPIVASADADTILHPLWIDTTVRRLQTEPVEAISCAGTFPPAFWRRVPQLTRAYASEIGTLFFPQETIVEFAFDPHKALFTEQLFLELGRMPSDCAFMLRKTAFVRVGGYFREYWPDGREILGEGWNLKFRLDRANTKMGYERLTPYETSPRRLLHDAERMLSGQSYSEGMSDFRETDEANRFAMLDKLAGGYDFDSVRRYIVRNYILLKAITEPPRPELLNYLGQTATDVLDMIRRTDARTAAEIHNLADSLLKANFTTILKNVRRLRDC